MAGWIDKLKSKIFRPKAASFTEFASGHPFLGGSAEAVSGTAHLNALRVAAVYACVRVIAQTVGTLPVELCRRDRGQVEPLPTRARGNLRRLLELLQHAPNPRMSALDMLGASTATLALHGNALIQIRRNVMGEPVEFNPIHPSLVDYGSDLMGLSKQWSSGDPAEPELQYTIAGQSSPLRADEVIHLRNLTFDGVYGVPVSVVGRQAVSIARAIDISNYRLFSTARPGMIWELPEGKSMTNEAYQRVVDSFHTAYSGPENAHKPIVGESGAKVKFASFSNEQSQMDESRISQQLEIARMMGVPPARIGIITHQPRASVEQENLAFVTQTIKFYTKVWSAALDRTLLTREQRVSGLCFHIPTRSLLTSSLADKASAYRSIGELGILTKNELRREVLGLEPLKEGGDEIAYAPNSSPEVIANENTDSPVEEEETEE